MFAHDIVQIWKKVVLLGLMSSSRQYYSWERDDSLSCSLFARPLLGLSAESGKSHFYYLEKPWKILFCNFEGRASL